MKEWLARGRRLARRLYRGFGAGCSFHGRGLDKLEAKLASAGLPPLRAQIEERLHASGRCKLLEIGCGEGHLLLDLLAIFGARLELHGMNHDRWQVLEGARGLHRINARYRVLPAAALRALPLPRVHFADAQDLSAFPERDFDLVISQVVLEHVPDKVRVLEESARLLAPGGRFIHELDWLDLPRIDFLDDDLPRLTIYRGRERLSARGYLAGKGLGIHAARARASDIVLATHEASGAPLRLGLELDRSSTFQLEPLEPLAPEVRFWGCRSVYSAASSR